MCIRKHTNFKFHKRQYSGAIQNTFVIVTNLFEMLYIIYILSQSAEFNGRYEANILAYLITFHRDTIFSQNTASKFHKIV